MPKTHPNLKLTGEYVPRQDNWSEGMNANIQTIDDLMFLDIVGIVAELPESGIAGEAFINSTDGSVNVWSGTEFNTHFPKKGWRGINTDEGLRYRYDGTSWIVEGPDAHFIEEHTDVDITNRVDGGALTYNATTEKHEYVVPVVEESAPSVRSVSTAGPDLMVPTDRIIIYDTSSGSIQATTPNVSENAGQEIKIQKKGTGLLTITGDIEVRPTVYLEQDGDSITFVSTGSDWIVTSFHTTEKHQIDLAQFITQSQDTYDSVGGTFGLVGAYDSDLTLNPALYDIGYEVNLGIFGGPAGSATGTRFTVYASVALGFPDSENSVSGTIIQETVNGISGAVFVRSTGLSNEIGSTLINYNVISDTTFRLFVRGSGTDFDTYIVEDATGALTNPDFKNKYYARRVGP